MTLKKETIEEIQRLSLEGLSNTSIAEELRIDAKTVGKYRGGKNGGDENNKGSDPGQAIGNPGSKERGELAARLFRRFRNGEKPEDVVVEEQVEPKVVSEFFEEWRQITEKTVFSIQSLEGKELKEMIGRSQQMIFALQRRVTELERNALRLSDLRNVACPSCGAMHSMGLMVGCASCWSFLPLDALLPKK
jgi:hypothetical protein